jgi:hypothetical protein
MVQLLKASSAVRGIAAVAQRRTRCRLMSRSSREAPVLMSSNPLSMLQRRFACARLSHPHMTQSLPRLLTEAAHGSLKPPPTRRLRRALLHLSCSMANKRLLGTTPEADRVDHPDELDDAASVDVSLWDSDERQGPTIASEAFESITAHRRIGPLPAVDQSCCAEAERSQSLPRTEA